MVISVGLLDPVGRERCVTGYSKRCCCIAIVYRHCSKQTNNFLIGHQSTTLSALGGTIARQSGLVVNGDVLYYKADVQTTEHLRVQGGHVAWLQQKDSFFNMLTVEETLELAAFLELSHFSERQRKRRVGKTMDSLGLTILKDRQIGDAALHHGLSGGEKRRLSLALELLSSPKLFIGDEPTSGLVSSKA